MKFKDYYEKEYRYVECYGLSCWKEYDIIIEKNLKALQLMEMDDIKKNDVQRVLNEVSATYSQSRYKKVQFLAKSILRNAYENDFTSCKVWQYKYKQRHKPPTDDKTYSVYTPYELEYITGTHTICADICKLMSLTGLRGEEIRGLRLKNINLDTMQIKVCECVVIRHDFTTNKQKCMHVKSTKNNRVRYVPICQSAAKIIRKYMNNGSEFLFRNSKYKYIDNSSWYAMYRANYKKAAQKFELENDGLLLPYYSAHNMRHCFCSALINNNIDPRTVCALAGHSDLTMTQRYTHSYYDTVQQAVNCLG